MRQALGGLLYCNSTFVCTILAYAMMVAFVPLVGRCNYSYMTLSEGCLGSGSDEDRSEMRYDMRIAESSESSKF